MTTGANSAAEYSLAIDQLARIDRTCSKEEMDELVYRLLSLIGEAVQSDRVFLFERLEGTAEYLPSLSGARTASRRRSTT